MLGYRFVSKIKNQILDFVELKRACGRRYEKEFSNLCHFDRFLFESKLRKTTLPKDLVIAWIERNPNESPNTQRIRISLIRQFAMYLQSLGIQAYYPCSDATPIFRIDYYPYIFSHNEMESIFTATDSMVPIRRNATYHIIFPMLIRLLYCCGLRIGEALNLTVGDYSRNDHVILIRNGKFGKGRFVPIMGTIQERLVAYIDEYCSTNPKQHLFESYQKRPYHQVAVGHYNRIIFKKAGISYGCKGKGPRVHDYRHTFAVHRFEQWLREGVDLNTMLPYLSSYMGHASLRGTQHYLRLTTAMFPELAQKMEDTVGLSIRRAMHENQ